MDELNKLTVIVPAYDEAPSLVQFLPALLDYCFKNQWNLILVNDGSGDNTKELLKQIPLSDKIQVIHHKRNRGYGAAIKSGISVCLTEYAITFDADGQHSLMDIHNLYELITTRDADMVVGSRINNKTGSY